MIIKSVELSDFRNYENLSLNFDKGINILYGDNAQGKTNLLEAIFLSLTTKSHKGAKDKECIRFSSNEAHIRTAVDRNGLIQRIDVHLRASKGKGVAIDGLKMKKASDFLKKLSARVIFFAPEDLEIIKGPPSGRRRYLDLELCQADHLYMESLQKYTKLLQQRSSVLLKIKENYKKNTFDKTDINTLLDIYDKSLVECGSEIIKKRAVFIENLNPVMKKVHGVITADKEDLSLLYAPNVNIREYEEELRLSRQKDIATAQTNCGPHRDDISFMVRNYHSGKLSNRSIDIRKFGSQGQQRTCALSMKLAEIELVKKNGYSAPIMLLDDVLPELDESRQNKLLSAIGDLQTIMTCTGLDDFVLSRLKVDKIFRVTDGNIEAQN